MLNREKLSIVRNRRWCGVLPADFGDLLAALGMKWKVDSRSLIRRMQAAFALRKSFHDGLQNAGGIRGNELHL